MNGADGIEVADVFRRHGEQYRADHRLPTDKLKVMRAVETCRTAALGGHLEQCEACGHQRMMYHSCRNRHCPKCGTGVREKWLYSRRAELLPIVYHHVVFTIPEELNAVALINQEIIYELLFRAASETLLELGRASKHLGGEIGVIAVLHTWGQNLAEHPHLHCIVTGGGLSNDGKRWVLPRKATAGRAFFIHVNILSALFKNKFMAGLCGAYESGRLRCTGRIAHLQEKSRFAAWKRKLYEHRWVTFCKGSEKRSERIIEYLGRYVHRVALGNSRLISMEADRVLFRWRDYRDGNRQKVMELEAAEFIRRFLLHVLPKGFYKIRYYGLFSNRNKKAKLQLCRKLLKVAEQENRPFDLLDALFELTGLDLSLCPCCHTGKMVIVKSVDPVHAAPP